MTLQKVLGWAHRASSLDSFHDGGNFSSLETSNDGQRVADQTSSDSAIVLIPQLSNALRTLIDLTPNGLSETASG